MAFNFFSRQPECLILSIEMQDARTASRIHGQAFARAWGDGEFESLISQQSVFGFLACPEGRARDAAAGFVLSREAAGEAEILSIGISPKAAPQRFGLALDAQRDEGSQAPRRRGNVSRSRRNQHGGGSDVPKAQLRSGRRAARLLCTGRRTGHDGACHALRSSLVRRVSSAKVSPA